MDNENNWGNKSANIPEVLHPADFTWIVYATDWYVHYFDNRLLDKITGKFRLDRLYIVEEDVQMITNCD
jgi:hypothetical protein